MFKLRDKTHRNATHSRIDNLFAWSATRTKRAAATRLVRLARPGHRRSSPRSPCRPTRDSSWRRWPAQEEAEQLLAVRGQPAEHLERLPADRPASGSALAC